MYCDGSPESLEAIRQALDVIEEIETEAMLSEHGVNSELTDDDAVAKVDNPALQADLDSMWHEAQDPNFRESLSQEALRYLANPFGNFDI